MSKSVNPQERVSQQSAESEQDTTQMKAMTPPTFQLAAGSNPPANNGDGNGNAIQRQEAPQQQQQGGGLNGGVPQAFIDHLRLREGWEEVVYLDSRQLPTVGLGHLLVGAERTQYPVGTRVPVAILEEWARQDSGGAYRAAQAQVLQLPAAAQNETFTIALASVNFQLGTAWNGEHRRTWAFMVAGQWEQAATEAADSAWQRQTPVRVADFQAALRALAGGNAAAQGVQGNGNTTPTATGTITGDDVNVRSGPGTNHGALRQLDSGASVSVYESQNGWVRIGAGQWVKADFVRQTPVSGGAGNTTTPVTNQPATPPTTTPTAPVTQTPVTTTPTTTPTSTGVVTGDNVNVRSGPGTNHPTVGNQLDKNAAVTIHETRNGWLRIGTGRWISAQFVRVNSATAPTTNTPVTNTPTTNTGTGNQQTHATGTAVASGTNRAAVTITAAVGAAGASNRDADVRKIQQLLKDLGFRISVTGNVGKNTIGAIAAFQKAVVGDNDGRVDPNGRTLQLMNQTPNGAFANTPVNLRDDDDAPRFTHSKWTNRAHLTTDSSGEVIPRPAYPAMRELIRNLGIIADNLQGTFNCNSGYRSPYYNSTVEGSAAQSNHQFGRACDIAASDYTPSQLRTQLRRLIREGKIHNGGIGLYSWGCHYDIDTAREW